MRKIIIIFFLLISTRVLISCCKDGSLNFRWSKTEVTNLDVSTNRPAILLQDSARIDKYGFRLLLEYERVAAHFIQGFGQNAAYALSCDKEGTNKDSVMSLEVTTQYAFDSSHPAGSSITEYLLTRIAHPPAGPDPLVYVPLRDNLYKINDWYNNGLEFKFKPVVPNPGQHTFIIAVNLQSGRTLTDSTSIKLY